MNYVVSTDFIFFGLTATCIFVFRRREKERLERGEPNSPAPASRARVAFRMPGHPVTTALFSAACWLVVANTVYRFPKNSAIGLGIVLAGIPVYFLWGRQRS